MSEVDLGVTREFGGLAVDHESITFLREAMSDDDNDDNDDNWAIELTPEEGQRLFERRCWAELGITAWEFLGRHVDGEYPSHWPHDAIVHLEILLPFCRGRHA